MYPEHQISILEGFLKDHVTLKTVMNNCRINTNQKHILDLRVWK